MLGAAFQPTYLQLDEDSNPADEPPVEVLPDDLPGSQTSYGRADYRRMFNAETIVNLHDTANSGAGGDVIETLTPAPSGNSHASSAAPLVLIAIAAFFLLGSKRR